MSENKAFDAQSESIDSPTDANCNARKQDLLDTHVEVEPLDKGKTDLLYDINSSPPWYLCILLGFQHYLTMFGATIAVPLLVTPSMCFGADNVAKSEVIGTIFFVSGLVTLLQATFGSRLPIIQGGTFSFLAPTFAILSLPQWKCPPEAPFNTTIPDDTNITYAPPIGSEAHRELWQSRMREVQGAIIVASLFQVIVGCSGIIGLLLRFIGPLAITPTISLIGLSLVSAAADFCSKQWWIALMTIALIIIFSQYLRNVSLPCVVYSREEKGCRKASFPVFKLFPVILAILLSWLVCFILTITNALPAESGKWGHEARTDTRIDVLRDAVWFRFPYPFQWGIPTVSVASVLGMLAGVIPSMIESIGDYYAAARLSGAPPPPVHAINRGIAMEGFGCILAGIWGTGNGTTSYGENIGAIGITKVGSRRVVQYASVVMLLLGVLGKFGALFVTIPDPIIGGVFMVMFGMVCAVGMSNLQFVDLNSSRNLCVLGLSFMLGLSVPQWIGNNSDAIKTGVDILDQIITVLLSTSMFVGGFVGFVLDNTVPGNRKERGLDKQDHSSTDEVENCYDMPFGMNLIRKCACAKYIPLCPTFGIGKKKTESGSQTKHNEDGDLKHSTNGNSHLQKRNQTSNTAL